MDYLPIFFDARRKRIAVVGGGAAGARKAEMALRAGADVCVFAKTLGDDFRQLAGHERLTHIAAWPSTHDLAGCVIVYSTLDDAAENNAVFDMAKQAGALVNVADAPDLCDFIMPSVVDRSPLVVAVSTSGASPVFGRMIRSRLESMIPAAYGRVVAFMGRYRERIGIRLNSPVARRRFWEGILEGSLADRVIQGRDEEADREIARALDEAESGERQASPSAGGEVYLVGAGPGDPDLLTFRALRLMQRADVVLHDRLIGEGILNLVRRDAERIYVGKLPQDHALPQQDLSELMVRLAREGKRVLRLKGGDPFMFGRGGEEVEKLAAEGIPFQVVPGVTAANGCAAYAGIPLTHRDHAQACVFVTAHRKDGGMDLDWTVLLQPRQTIVIFMGLAQIEELMNEFIARGADPSLPAAVIDNGTRPNQTVISGTLSTLAGFARARDHHHRLRRESAREDGGDSGHELERSERGSVRTRAAHSRARLTLRQNVIRSDAVNLVDA